MTGGGRRLREYGLTSGTLGSNGAQTLMVALLPVLLERTGASALVIGVVIGAEGLLAIVVPYWIGALSDRLPDRWARRYGRRTIFLWATAPVMVAAAAATPFLSGFWWLAGAGLVFFAALHGYLTPLWTLMLDAVPDERRDPVQGVRGAFQAGGLAFGLVGGGLLFGLAEPLPFLTAGLLILGTTWLTVRATPREAASKNDEPGRHPEGEEPVWRRLLRKREIRWFLIANALWTGAVDGIRPYIFLFAVAVLGVSVAETSVILLCLLAGLGIGAIVIGRLAKRFGRERVLAAATAVTGVAMTMGVFVRDVPGAIALLAVAGIAAAAFIALPFPLFASMAGEEAAGRQTALYIISLGIARVLSPILVGGAIEWGMRLAPEEQGYPYMWLVAGALVILSVPALLRSVSLAPDRRAAL